MSRVFKFSAVFILFLISVSAWCADLSSCYKTIQDEKEIPDSALAEIFKQETSTIRILEAVGFCASRIKDKFTFFKKTANLALMINKFEIAQKYYKKAYDAKPDDWESLYMSSVLLYEQGEFEAASTGFKTVNKSAAAPLREDAVAMLGAVRLSEGNRNEGIVDLNKALLSKNDSTLYLVYDIASAFSLGDLKDLATRKLKAEGFEGKLVLGGASFPVTPSRIFITPDYSQTTISKTVEVNKNAAVQTDESQTVRRPVAIQVGSFGNSDNAKKMEFRLIELGFKPAITTLKAGSKTFYKVAITVDEDMDVNNAVLLLKDNSIESYFVF